MGRHKNIEDSVYWGAEAARFCLRENGIDPDALTASELEHMASRAQDETSLVVEGGALEALSAAVLIGADALRASFAAGDIEKAVLCAMEFVEATSDLTAARRFPIDDLRTAKVDSNHTRGAKRESSQSEGANAKAEKFRRIFETKCIPQATTFAEAVRHFAQKVKFEENKPKPLTYRAALNRLNTYYKGQIPDPFSRS